MTKRKYKQRMHVVNPVHYGSISRGNLRPSIVYFQELHSACTSSGRGWGVDGTDAMFIEGRTYEEKFGPLEKKELNRLVHICKQARLLVCLEEFPLSSGVNNRQVLAIMINLAKYYSHWQQDPEHFKPTFNKSCVENAYDLVEFSMSKYSVPRPLRKIWNHCDKETKDICKKKEWYVNVGLGGNIRKEDGIPIPLTKKAAHCFGQAPEQLSLDESFRWAQLFSMGMANIAIAGVMSTPLSNNFDDEPFWVSVIHFFNNNCFIAPDKYREIFDYINNVRYETTRALVDGTWMDVEPEQPDFSMKGRNPNTLLRDVDEWHDSLRIVRNEGYSLETAWASSVIKNHSQPKNGNYLVICELLSAGELHTEGKAMHHCVYSYARNCIRGTTSIFSLRMVDKEGKSMDRYATIEVSLSSFKGEKNRLVQVRGPCNISISREEMDIIRKWADKNDLTISSYIGTGV